MYDKDDAEAVMKRCRAGTKNYDEANGLHADCYGTIGGAVYEIATLRARLDRAVALLRKAVEYAEEKKTDHFTPYFVVEFIDYTDMEKIRAMLAEEE